MLSSFSSSSADPQFMAAIFAAFAAAATVITLAMPLVEGSGLSKRMKAVARRARPDPGPRARADR